LTGLWGIFSVDNLVKMIVTGLPALIIALIVPRLIVKVTLRQFYSQKWWETKSNAYLKIVEHLCDYNLATGQLFDHHVDALNLSEELIDKYHRIRTNTYAEILKQKIMGDYILSSRSITALESLLKNFESNWNRENYVVALDDDYGFVKECIEEIRVSAKMDLKVK
jgi:hypothetical protein